MTEAACFTYSVINSFYYFIDGMSLKTRAQLILNNSIILESPVYYRKMVIDVIVYILLLIRVWMILFLDGNELLFTR